MPVRFEPMTDEDFQAYLRRAIPEYAHEYVHTGNWHPNEAVGRAREQFMRIFPQGPRSPHQHLFTVWDAETGLKVGMLWYTLDESRLKKMAFLSDFFILMEYQKRGYEEAALALLEAELRSQGVQRMEINLFAHNTQERALYEKHGFGVVSLYLGKDIE